ncbi:MAG: hypothetical protein ACI9MC_002329, partial [Kiritimatiellia bacterium]
MRHLPTWCVVVSLAGCGGGYADYWTDDAVAPSMSGVEPATIESLLGGQQVVISGSGLASTQTVVIGDRNAEIIEATAQSVTVRVPARSAGGGAVDLALVTDNGLARLSDGLVYNTPINEFVADEVASLAVLLVDCPIEAWALWDDEWYPVLWCGVEQGYASASAMGGGSLQRGYAGDVGGLTPLSTLPSAGELAVWGPDDRRPPKLPVRYGTYAPGDTIALTTPRDFARDVDFAEQRLDMVAQYYSWYDLVESEGTFASTYDDAQCWTGDYNIDGAEGSELILDEEVEGVGAALIGLWIEEDVDGSSELSEGITGAAR